MSPEWWAVVPLAAFAFLAWIRLTMLLDVPFWLETALAGTAAFLFTGLVRYALVIEGAPWVSLTASEEPWEPGRSVFGIRLG